MYYLLIIVCITYFNLLYCSFALCVFCFLLTTYCCSVTYTFIVCFMFVIVLCLCLCLLCSVKGPQMQMICSYNLVQCIK